MEKRKLTTWQISIDAMLSAVVAVLGYVALDLGTMKITFESLPILFAALMYGPVDGMLVGGIGTLLYQILRYGFSATTALWILPYVVIGLIAGLYAKKYRFNNSRTQILLIVTVCEILVWALNTGVIYVDSKIYGYYTPAYILGALFIRFVIAVAKSVVFGLLMPPVLRRLSRVTGNGPRGYGRGTDGGS